MRNITVGPERIRITVVTPCLNSRETIRDNIESITSQSYPANHVIIDGVSTDGTLDVIRKCCAENTTIVSEPDHCEFDAMNKGVALADGDVINILNSDDFYAHEDVLAKVAEVFQDPKIDCCYGDLVYVDKTDTDKVVRLWKSGPYDPNRFLRGWMPPHPTFFLRREIYRKFGGYRLDLPLAADYELMLRYMFKHRITVAYIPEVLVRMRTGGKANVTLRHRLAAHKSARKAWTNNGLKPKLWTLPLKPLSKITQYFVRS